MLIAPQQCRITDPASAYFTPPPPYPSVPPPAAVARETPAAGLVSQSPGLPDAKAPRDVGRGRVFEHVPPDTGARPLRAGSHDTGPFADGKDGRQ